MINVIKCPPKIKVNSSVIDRSAYVTEYMGLIKTQP